MESFPSHGVKTGKMKVIFLEDKTASKHTSQNAHFSFNVHHISRQDLCIFIGFCKREAERTCPEMQEVYIVRAYLLCSIDKCLFYSYRKQVPLIFVEEK